MSIPTNPSEPFSPFLPATFSIPEEEDRRRSYLVDTFSSISDVVNDKHIGIYLQGAEAQNGRKLWYDSTAITRNGYQYLARIVSFPANGSIVLTPPPNINQEFVVFMVWGSASKPPTSLGAGNGEFFSFFGSGNPKISFTFTDLAITVTTVGLGAGYTGFIVCDYVHRGI